MTTEAPTRVTSEQFTRRRTPEQWGAVLKAWVDSGDNLGTFARNTNIPYHTLYGQVSRAVADGRIVIDRPE